LAAHTWAGSFVELTMDSDNAPAGDIGNHVLPKAIIILTGVIALIILAIRLYARFIMRRLGISDILLVISMVIDSYEAFFPEVTIFNLGSIGFLHNTSLQCLPSGRLPGSRRSPMAI
jgi:hypothetical protein